MASRLKSRIRGPLKKQLGNSTDADAEFDKSWALLSEAFREIHRQNAGEYSFEQLYRNAYNIVTKKQGDRLHDGFAELVSDHLSDVNKSALASAYVPINTQEADQGIANDAKIHFLNAVLAAWDLHCLCLGMFADVLMYMDRSHSKTGHRPNVYDTGLAIFRDAVLHSQLDPTGDRIVQVLLQLIAYERSGHLIDRALVKRCLEMLATLDIQSLEGPSTVYVTDFESHFLTASREFYIQESSQNLLNMPVEDYLIQVERRLAEEESRVTSYMQEGTRLPLITLMEEECIRAHLKHIVEADSGLGFMLRSVKVNELQLMHALLGRVDSNHALHNEKMTAIIISTGQRINQSLSDETAAAARDKPNALSLALRWVQETLDLRDTYYHLLSEAYGNDQTVANAITLAFSTFVNQNARSAEFVSLFIDDHLKKGLRGKSEDVVESILGKTVSLFRFLQDKDVFERYYKTHLGKRLLSGRSVSDDAERSMIARLKVEMGSNFTNKLEGMFKDIKISGENMRKFKALDTRAESPAILQATVLTSTFWPLGVAEMGGQMTCRFPDLIDRHCKSFEAFYLQHHTGRQLTWVPSQGTADLKALFGSKVYELSVSTYAMVVLMHFNDVPPGAQLTTEELHLATNISLPDLSRTLQSLACAKFKLLAKSPKSREVQITDCFSVNASFTNPQTRIKIATIANKTESNAEQRETLSRVEETRKHSTEACIVRIMKARKSADHNNLIAEVTQQLSTKFTPDLAMIKGRIESLIERDYLERDECDRKLYRYVA